MDIHNTHSIQKQAENSYGISSDDNLSQLKQLNGYKDNLADEEKNYIIPNRYGINQ